MRRLALSSSEYLLALGVLYAYFQSRPKLFFLREQSEDRKLFARYLHWISPIRHWADWQLVLLYNLYERRKNAHQLYPSFCTDYDYSIQALLLRYYMYSEHNPAKTEDVLKNHPHWTKEQKKAIYHIEHHGYVPSFFEIFHHFSLKKDDNVLFFSKPLCFRSSAQHPALISLKAHLQDPYKQKMKNKKENIVVCQ